MDYEKYGLRDASAANVKRTNSVLFLITHENEMVVIELNHPVGVLPNAMIETCNFAAVLAEGDDDFEYARLIRVGQPNGKVFSSKTATMQAIYDFGRHLELVQP